MKLKMIPVIWLLVALISHIIVLSLYWGAVHATMPDKSKGFHLRTDARLSPLFMFEEDYIAFAPIKLDFSAKHVIIHGSSQAATGLKPDLIAPNQDIIVNNFAVRKAGFKRIAAVNSMLWNKGALNEESTSHMIIAFGLLSFIEHHNQDRFFDSKEMISQLPLSATRGGEIFYKRFNQHHPLFWFLSRPMILLQMKFINLWPSIIGVKKLPIPIPVINAPYDMRIDCLQSVPPLDDNMSAKFSEEAFKELELFLNAYESKRFPVTIVNVPMHSCLLNHKDYIYFKQRIINIIKSYKVLFIDHSNLLDDEYFFDPNHVNVEGAKLWSAEMKRYLSHGK